MRLKYEPFHPAPRAIHIRQLTSYSVCSNLDPSTHVPEHPVWGYRPGGARGLRDHLLGDQL